MPYALEAQRDVRGNRQKIDLGDEDLPVQLLRLLSYLQLRLALLQIQDVVYTLNGAGSSTLCLLWWGGAEALDGGVDLL